VGQLNLDDESRLSPQDKARLEAMARKTVREVSARRDLIREGEKPRGVILILEGWACAYKHLPDGRRQITSFLVPGDLCDANAFLLDEMDHSIGAVTAARYGEIEARDFSRLIEESPDFSRALWRHELTLAAINREWVVNVGQRNAYERLAHLFCELVAKLEAAGLAQADGCEFPLTQADLADAVGLTSVHVNRTLRALRNDGLIELRGRKLIVRDLAGLRRAGHFNPNYLHLEARDERAA
jgi:CRP-like cAMP-binding protein